MLGDYRFIHFLRRIIPTNSRKWPGLRPHMKFLYLVGFGLLSPVVLFVGYSPVICFYISLNRLRQQDYGSDGDASKANLRPALNLFYSLTLAQGAIFISVLIFQNGFTAYFRGFIRRHDLNGNVFAGYIEETQVKYMNNQASSETWNFVTYGVGLLDSELQDDFVTGVHALNVLIENGRQLRCLLIGSPRHRIQKLFSALGWRSLKDRKTRGLAARIVAHLASDLHIAEFPGSLESICSLLDTSVHYWDDQEVLNISSERIRRKRRRGLLFTLMRKYRGWKNRNPDSGEGTNGDLLLQGLRILENLALDKRNCAEIWNNSNLVSTVLAPFSNDQFIKDIKTGDAWTNVVDASLRVVVQLMKAPGDIGTKMRQRIAGKGKSVLGPQVVAPESKEVENLLAVLGPEFKSCSRILELQTSAIEALAQLFADESTCISGETRADFIRRTLVIYLTDEKWMEDYLSDRRKRIDEEITNQLMEEDDNPSFLEELCPCLMERKNKKRRKSLQREKMEEAQEAVREHKEVAGKALAMLSMGSESNKDVIMNFKECKIKTIKLFRSTTEPLLEVGINTGCRISAACILKNLCAHSMICYILLQILEELLEVKRGPESHRERRSSRNNCETRRNDIENPPDGSQHGTTQRYLQQPEDRMFQAAMLSLYTTIRTTWMDTEDFASVVVKLVAQKDFVGTLKAVVEENNHATPACLALLKVTCEIVILLIKNGHFINDIKEKLIIDALSESSNIMSGLESCMLFAGLKHDCLGLPVKPLSSALVEQAKLLL
ncbi:hypothetical protein PVAP13_1NG207900 [Panicum virgatum]|uniref:Uncharacterized protein n=1 Tax=Panicum virgatum TaxID=38727 RepID=A0A8T0X0V0_PANVG|nr:hypothetical protein PVAP13_1NG207900 [Panicum virgatum]